MKIYISLDIQLGLFS